MYSLNDIVDAYRLDMEPSEATAPKAQFGKLLEAARAGQNWHSNVRDVVASLVSRGVPDDHIHALIDSSVTQHNYTEEQTFKQVQELIDGWRKRKKIPNPADDGQNQTPLTLDFVGAFDPLHLPPRPWIVGYDLLAGYLTLLVAAPGVGKSLSSLLLAIAVATGRDLLGATVHQSGCVWVYNNEDDPDEIKRRLAALAAHHNIPLTQLASKIAVNSGMIRRLIVAALDGKGNVRRTADVDACVEMIKKHNVKVFIVDPMVETHEADENDNVSMRTVAGLFREIAQRANCAVLLVHHTAKPPQGSSEGHAGNMNTARGAGSVIGVARVVKTIFGMSVKDAKELGIPNEERHMYLRLDDAKANLSLASPNARWFKKIGVKLPNGDEVGVIELHRFNLEKLYNDENERLKPIVEALDTVPDIDGKTINAAAIWLAWNDSSFSKYQEEDSKGHKRAKRPFREAIQRACDRSIPITRGTDVIAFRLGLDSSENIIILRGSLKPI